MQRSELRTAVWWGLAYASLCVFLAWRFPVHGVWHDDGLYMQLGVSLSEGGFHLRQFGDALAQGRYPPVFPAVLACVAAFGVDPSVSPWLFCIPGALLAATGWILWYAYLREWYSVRESACIMGLVALGPMTLQVCYCAMSEPVVFVLVPAVLLLARRGTHAWTCGVLLALIVMTRAALVPIPAIMGIAAWRKRGLGAALPLVLPAFAAGVAWLWWKSTMLPHEESPIIQYYADYHPRWFGLSAEVQLARIGDVGFGAMGGFLGGLYLPEVSDWLGTSGANARDVLVSVLGVALLVPLLRGRHRFERVGAAVVAGAVVMCLSMRFRTWRYFLPVLPLALASGADIVRRLDGSGRLARVVVAVGAVSAAVALVPQIQLDRETARFWTSAFPVREFEAQAAWIRDQAPSDATIATDFDTYFHRVTGCRATLLAGPRPDLEGHPELWDAWAQRRYPLQLAEYRALGVTHLMTNPHLEPWLIPILHRLDREGRVRQVHRGRHPGFRILRLVDRPEPERR